MVKITICYNKRNPCFDPTRIGDNQPELRQDKILAQLKSENFDRIFIDINPIYRAEIEFNKILLKITTPEFVVFLSNAYSIINEFTSNSVREMYMSPDRGLVPYNFCRDQPSNRFGHSYLQMAYYATDQNSPIYLATHSVAVNCLKVIKTAVSQLTHDYPIVYALTTYPGHHASLNQYGGYCFFNNAVYGLYLIKERFNFKKMAILDIDYHHGDGSERLTKDDPKCLTVSIHADPQLDYPGVTGHDSETDNNLNITFQPKILIEAYLVKLDQALEKIDKFGAEGVVIALGLDTLKDDPDACCDMVLLPKHFMEIGRKISKRLYQNPAMKVLITQEGGYNLEKIPQAVSNFLKGFENGHRS